MTDEDGDVVGRLNRNMYGFRDAANGWFEDWKELFGTSQYRTGIANPAFFYNSQRALAEPFMAMTFTCWDDDATSTT